VPADSGADRRRPESPGGRVEGKGAFARFLDRKMRQSKRPPASDDEAGGPPAEARVAHASGRAPAADRAVRRAPAIAGPDAPRPGERVLLGRGVDGAEARVRIGEGPLAGAELRLVVRGAVIDAQVLTPGAASRQTLAVAMDEVAARLGRRNIRLRAAERPSPGGGRREQGGRE